MRLLQQVLKKLQLHHFLPVLQSTKHKVVARFKEAATTSLPFCVAKPKHKSVASVVEAATTL